MKFCTDFKKGGYCMNLFDFWKMSMNGLTEANQKQTKNKKIYPLIILMLIITLLYFLSLGIFSN